MTLEDLDALRRQLIAHEGSKLFVYDDATGQSIRPGTTVIGNPTIGVGRELGRHGISIKEAAMLLENDITETINALEAQYGWFHTLDGNGQRAIVDLAFNVGVNGLQKSPKMLAALVANDRQTAAAELLNGPWKTQVGPTRANDVAALLRG